MKLFTFALCLFLEAHVVTAQTSFPTTYFPTSDVPTDDCPQQPACDDMLDGVCVKVCSDDPGYICDAALCMENDMESDCLCEYREAEKCPESDLCLEKRGECVEGCQPGEDGNGNEIVCAVDLCPERDDCICQYTIEGTEFPSSFYPTTLSPTPSPTTSYSPSESPSSAAPTGTAKPTESCKCCDCTRTCSITPDPHYWAWDGSWYDFQGGCDQYAVKNDKIEIQIATRPRNNYSTITQVSVKMLSTGGLEKFKVKADAIANPVVNTFTTSASVANLGYGFQINFNGVPSPSFIRITGGVWGYSLQIQGHGSIFEGSLGMCGSWNNGGVLLEDQTRYNDVRTDPFNWPGMLATQATSFPVAQSWQVAVADSDLVVPSPHCENEKYCTNSVNFPCNSFRRRLGADDPIDPTCSNTCDDITEPFSKAACEADVQLTQDTSWACQPSYEEPVFVIPDPCSFDRLDDQTCSRDFQDRCGKMGGSCVLNCEDNEDADRSCLPGICSPDDSCMCSVKMTCPPNTPSPAPSVCDEPSVDDPTCSRDAEDTCGAMGGSCVINCEESEENGRVCLPGICSPDDSCMCSVEMTCPSAFESTNAPTSEPIEFICEDSTQPLLVNTLERDCGWVAKEKDIRCAKGSVSTHCPMTCGACDAGCFNSGATFKVDTLDKFKTCKWVGTLATNYRCGLIGEDNGRSTCPKFCGGCPSTTPSPTIAPTTSSPNTFTCEDSTQPLLVNEIERDCDWVAKEKEVRCAKYGKVSTHCQKTCDYCDAGCKNSVATFKVDTLDKFRTCKWVGTQSTNYRCGLIGEDNGRSTCPEFCDGC